MFSLISVLFFVAAIQKILVTGIHHNLDFGLQVAYRAAKQTGLNLQSFLYPLLHRV